MLNLVRISGYFDDPSIVQYIALLVEELLNIMTETPTNMKHEQ